ncbi:rheacalcin-1-like isoform X1 [Nyctibius grandis]|uniref:rheacalcin-1-like isoform X1 n=1 Tax=Nyctibius grandis TaxID=48427 RepID=UPI0035BBBE71
MGPAAFVGLCLLGCLALRPSLQGVQANKCPRGWLDFRGHCYGYFGQELAWRKAEACCRATRAGGHLASLHTPEEHRALAAFIAQRQRREEEEESVWIGLYHRRQAWMWADGSQKRYSAGDGEDFPVGRRCAALEESSGFMSWEEEPCSERKPFVCKSPA